MEDTIRIQVMGNYLIYINEQRVENPVAKSRKGAALMAFLILNRGQSVPNQRLLRCLWQNHKVTNPENALKTLVSRMRTLLNQMLPGLGNCIVSDRGAYHWESLTELRVDVLELMDLFDALSKERDTAALREMYRRVIELYRGDLIQTGELEEEAAYAQQLHTQYLNTVYSYIELLKHDEAYNEISAVCRDALEVDTFDDRLHIELMKAMINLNRANEAMMQYKHATNMIHRYLGAEPSQEMQEFYRQMSRTRHTLKFNLDAIRNELYEGSNGNGAFVCEYPMFREIYNLQMRNLERLGTAMCLGIIMVGEAEDKALDTLRRETVMRSLIDILQRHLRKGDVVAQYAPSILAMLLPTANYKTGAAVLERIQMIFYKQYPNSDLSFHYRLGMLGNVSREDLEEGELER